MEKISEKFVAPYREASDSAGRPMYVRETIMFPRKTLGIVYPTYPWQGQNYWAHSYSNRTFPSLEKTKQGLDRYLTVDGYILLTNEQYEKLSVLL